MINVLLPEPLIWALRWSLLLGPLALLIILVQWRKPTYRQQVGGFFAFLYGASAVFLTHSMAAGAGWWHYGWNSLMLNGVPADIIIGGSVLFGPVLYFAFPRVSPILLCVIALLGMHGIAFGSIAPLVIAGPWWIWGVIFVFATAHAPALYLARWTELDLNLPLRATLLALMYAGLSLGVLPTLIMTAMGGEWALSDRPLWSWVALIVGLAVSFVIGLSAVQMLAVQGRGTAIPLDPTTRLVRSGIYSYVRNPMQLSAALSWVVLGLFLQNIWIMAAAVMAWIFVEGIVRWHHRNDLLQRFPEDWTQYRQDVSEWQPHWRPACRSTAQLSLDMDRPLGRVVATLIHRAGKTNLDIRSTAGEPQYDDPTDIVAYRGVPALCMALTRTNFALALLGHAILLPALSLQAWSSKTVRA